MPAAGNSVCAIHDRHFGELREAMAQVREDAAATRVSVAGVPRLQEAIQNVQQRVAVLEDRDARRRRWDALVPSIVSGLVVAVGAAITLAVIL